MRRRPQLAESKLKHPDPLLPDNPSIDTKSWSYIGRQPIVDSHYELVGYELRYQTSDQGSADSLTPDWSLAVEAVADFGLDRLVGRHLAFVGASAAFIASSAYLVLPQNQIVLHLGPDSLNPSVKEGLHRAASRRYMLAGSLEVAEAEGALLDFVIIEVDELKSDGKSLSDKLKHCAPKARMVVTEIVTHAELAMCKTLGFDAFSGPFVEQPTVMSGRSSTAPSMALLELAAALQEQELTLKHLASILERDLALPYRLLRLANSGAMALPAPVESILDALVLLGTETVRQLASVLAISTLTGGSEYLVEHFTARAKFCEVIAQSVEPPLASSAFTTGLFSGLEALLGEPIDKIVKRLPLNASISSALVRREGPLGDILSLAIDYERGNIERIGPDMLRICAAAFDTALRWASHLRPDIRSAGRGASNPLPGI